jgi:thiosulfate/3-mercaptopyruvate sulfurtransferase
VRFVDSDWVRARLGSPELQVLDPRLRVRYTSGHLQGAIHVSVARAYDPGGGLLGDEDLAAWLAASGVRTDKTVLIYDQGDAQAGALLAWILEYLGHPDVVFLRESFESWRDGGGELFYRPIPAPPRDFQARPRPELRARREDVLAAAGSNLIDVRSAEEFSGEQVMRPDEVPGHIPGARNIAWLSFIDGDPDLFVPAEEVDELLRKQGIDPNEPTIVYCRSGLRAAAVTLALLQVGLPARLYDGSWLDWCKVEDPLSADGSGCEAL